MTLLRSRRSRPNLRARTSKVNRKISRLISDDLNQFILFDRVVSKDFNGQFTSPISQNSIRYNVRMLDIYCKETGKKPDSLSKEELERFILTK